MSSSSQHNQLKAKQQEEEVHQHQQQFVLESGNNPKRHRLIFQVHHGHRSQYTAYKYRVEFNHFLDFIKIHDLEVLLDLGKEAIQELVIRYAISLRDDPVKKYSRSTVNTRIASILYFLDNNDIELNKRKIRRYFPSDESVKDDRQYSVKEIQRILSVCDLRTKAMILLMESSGVRIGSLSSMRVEDLIEISYKSLCIYKVRVYARTRSEYYSFTNLEAYTALREYLEWRRRCKEEIKDKSPLFRKHFNKEDPFTINAPRFLTEAAVMKSVDEALKKSGVKTTEAMRSHAWRKGFMSICEQKGMKSINVKMLLGHDIGVSGHYYRPAESDILEDYMTHAADALTIDPTKRLQKENHDLKTVQAEELENVKQGMENMKDWMKHCFKQIVEWTRPLNPELARDIELNSLQLDEPEE